MAEQDVTLGEVYRVVQKIEAHMDNQNGRLRTAEGHIAVLQDRSDDAQRAKWTDRILGGITAAVLGGIELWRR